MKPEKIINTNGTPKRIKESDFTFIPTIKQLEYIFEGYDAESLKDERLKVWEGFGHLMSNDAWMKYAYRNDPLIKNTLQGQHPDIDWQFLRHQARFLTYYKVLEATGQEIDHPIFNRIRKIKNRGGV